MSATEAGLAMRAVPSTTAHLFAGIVRVCMVCHPGESIFTLRPEWRMAGVTISHGICIACSNRMLAEAESIAKGEE